MSLIAHNERVKKQEVRTLSGSLSHSCPILFVIMSCCTPIRGFKRRWNLSLSWKEEEEDRVCGWCWWGWDAQLCSDSSQNNMVSKNIDIHISYYIYDSITNLNTTGILTSFPVSPGSRPIIEFFSNPNSSDIEFYLDICDADSWTRKVWDVRIDKIPAVIFRWK